MDTKLFYGRRDFYEAYDYLVPRLPKFFRYRVLFLDFLGTIFDGDEETIDNTCGNDTGLRLLYKLFYNMTKVGAEKPITICDVKYCDDEGVDEDDPDFTGDHEDYEAHREDVILMATDWGYKKTIKAWEQELMVPDYEKIR